MEIKLELSDSLVGVVEVSVSQSPSWRRAPLTTSTFVAAHRLLLAQLLALNYNAVST